eukprot:m.249583 g.249583  ORF g.249583 m.249583 type:complete len:63 (+) comp17167_c0_seq1:1108-1296(+)
MIPQSQHIIIRHAKFTIAFKTLFIPMNLIQAVDEGHATGNVSCKLQFQCQDSQSLSRMAISV